MANPSKRRLEFIDDVSTRFEEIYEHPTTCPSEADTNDLPPRSAEEICLPTTPVSGINQQIVTHLVDITTPEKIPELFYETIPTSTVVVPLVNHHQTDQLSESGNVVEQTTEITHDRIQQTARVKRRLNLGKLPQTVLRAQEEQEPDQLSKDCLDIPKNSAEFIYHQARIPIAVNQFHNSTFLGRGKFGSAHSVTITEPLNMSMAVKRIPFPTDDDSRLSIYAERRAMEKIGSERTRYIVDYYCSMIDPQNNGDLCIYMELMDTTVAKFYEVLHPLNGDVSDKLDLFVRRCAHDVTRGLHFLETEDIVHRDVKPTNMLINERAVIKLCDFGICGHLTDNTYDFSVCVGTTAYLPPKPEKCTIQNDMWALGISLLEIIDGKQPFAHHPTYGIDFKIAAWKPTVPTTISINIQKFILQLLKIAAQDRPRSYLELINKSFIVNMTEIPSSEEIDFVQRIINTISPSRCLNG